jgi:lysophospholipase L1-like esterase
MKTIQSASIVRADNKNLVWTGRVDRKPDGPVTMAYPGVELRFRVKGTSQINATFTTTNDGCWFGVFIDDIPLPKVHLVKGNATVTLAENLDPKRVYTVRVVRRTESWLGVATLHQLDLGTGGQVLSAPRLPKKRLLFIGDSITCGEKTECVAPDYLKDARAWNADISFGHVLGRRLEAQVHLVSYGGRGVFRDWQGKDNTQTSNAPIFFERTLPDDPNILWNHASYVPDAVIIGLGTNDFSKSIPEESVFVSAYVAFLQRIRAVYPRTFLCVTDSPITIGSPERGPVLTKYLQSVVAQVTQKGDKKIAYVPVRYQSGSKADAHPDGAQHQRIADDLEPVLRKALGVK